MGTLLNRRRYMGGGGSPQPSYDENSYTQDGLIFQLDGIAKGNSADLSTWVDLKGGLVFEQADGTVQSTANGWYFDGTCRFTCASLLSGSSNYTIEVCSSKFITWHNGTWTSGHPYFYVLGNNLYFLQRNVPLNNSKIGTLLGNPFTASLNLDRTYINKTLYTGRGSSNLFSDPSRFDIGCYRNAYSKGTFYALRVYSRRLTEEEQLHNMDVDMARFNISV